MSKFIVAIFPDEAKAIEGRKELNALHEEGELTLFAAAVLTKADDGSLQVKEEASPGPLGAGLTALVGGLVGLLGGPVIAAFGAIAGGLSGGFLDLVKVTERSEFLEEIADKLAPGKSAVVAEASEDRVTPLDMRMEALGGVVVREMRPEADADRIEREAAARKTALERLEAEQAEVDEEARAKLDELVAQARTRLEDVSERARDMMGRLEEESEAQTAAMREQAERANPEVRTRIEKRIAETRAEQEKRAAKLRQAFELAKEALAP